jgi:hypothetical protein
MPCPGCVDGSLDAATEVFLLGVETAGAATA